MVEVFVLLVVCSLLAYFFSYNSVYRRYEKAGDGVYEYQRTSGASKFVFAILVMILICFSGLRTFMNDTATYLNNFNKVMDSLEGIKHINWSLGANPLFHIYQIIIRTFISSNGSTFIFITAVIVVYSNLMFIKKYSINFAYSIYMYLAFTIYAFTMAAMKQTLAISIAIWAIPYLLEGKPMKGAILILLAMFVHPYVAIYLAIFVMSKGIWDIKTVLMIFVTIIASMSFSTLIPKLIEVTSTIGDEYSIEMLTGQGVSIFRVLVYLVVPGLSFIYRNNIREYGNKFVYLCINLSTISSCLMILGSSGGANLFGRMANYFDLFQCLALPIIFRYGIRGRKTKNLFKFLGIIGFAFFYYTYYSKYIGRGDCFYNHITLLELIRNW